MTAAAVSLRGRSFLKELDFTPAEWRYLLDLAATLKEEKKAGEWPARLAGKNIALVFEKTSTRTRCSFEVAAYDQGAHVTYLDPTGSQFGHKESVADSAQVLGRFYDAIEYRGFAQETAETLARLSGVPVWNGLTDEWHPTQMLADQLTMLEHSKKDLAQIAVAYVGDARNNVANSMLIASAMMGMDIRIGAPAQLWNDGAVIERAQHIAATTGARITHTTDAATAVRGADFVYTDVWVSMGEPKEVWSDRIALLRPYQVDAALMETAGPGAMFMHCLPAYHDLGTEVGRQIHALTGLSELEVTDEVFSGPASIVFDQAENRMHTIKAVMVATLGE